MIKIENVIFSLIILLIVGVGVKDWADKHPPATPDVLYTAHCQADYRQDTACRSRCLEFVQGIANTCGASIEVSTPAKMMACTYSSIDSAFCEVLYLETVVIPTYETVIKELAGGEEVYM